MVQSRIDWLYALSLKPGEVQFDFNILSDFRQRLLDHEAQDLLLDPIIQICRERGWLKERGKQQTDSTMVLARLHLLSSIESVGEGLRAALNAIAEVDPDWLLAHLNEEWFDRYVHQFELARFPKEESKRKKLRADVGRDAQLLLSMVQRAQTPKRIQTLPEIKHLTQVFEQHYREM